MKPAASGRRKTTPVIDIDSGGSDSGGSDGGGSDYEPCGVEGEPYQSNESAHKEAENEDKKTSEESGFYPHCCLFCGKGYTYTKAFKEHMTRKHWNQSFTTTTCSHPQCDRQFENVTEYRAHCQATHGLTVCRVGNCTFTASSQQGVDQHDNCAHKGQFLCRLGKHLAHSKGSVKPKIRRRKATSDVDGQECKSDLKKGLTQAEGEEPSGGRLPGVAVTVKTEVVDADLAHGQPAGQPADQAVGSGAALDDMEIKAESVDQPSKRGRGRPRKGDRQDRHTQRMAFSWCRLCNKQLIDEMACKEHLKQKHQDKIFACQLCDSVYLRKEALTRHVALL
jgi:hypothetical protein